MYHSFPHVIDDKAKEELPDWGHLSIQVSIETNNTTGFAIWNTGKRPGNPPSGDSRFVRQHRSGQQSINVHTQSWVFHKHTKLATLALMPILWSYICSFLFYLHQLMSINVKLHRSIIRELHVKVTNFIVQLISNSKAKNKFSNIVENWVFLVEYFAINIKLPILAMLTSKIP